MNREVVKHFTIIRDKLILQAGKQDKNQSKITAKPIKAVLEEKEQEYNDNSEKRLRETKCPHGKKFGYDYWYDYEVCKVCGLVNKCNDLNDILEDNGEIN